MPVSAGVVRSKFSTRKKGHFKQQVKRDESPYGQYGQHRQDAHGTAAVAFSDDFCLGYAALAFGRGGVVPGFLRVQICRVGRWLRGEDFFGGCWRGVPGFSSPIRLPMLRLGACE